MTGAASREGGGDSIGGGAELRLWQREERNTVQPNEQWKLIKVKQKKNLLEVKQSRTTKTCGAIKMRKGEKV